MCGIAGKVFFEAEKSVSRELLKRMTDTIVHRGPDDEGFFIDGNFGFGMRRLSIIDLAGGHQPIFNKEKSLAIIFNGEIYNYLELKKDLEKIGYIFQTNSDTETILHCYEQYGMDFIHKLNGMFAIAIWDIKNRRLVLIRDRLGIKPLYYYLDNEKLLFGSEIKAIIEDETIERRVNTTALDLYLGFMYIPAPHSMFENIYKLPPAHYLIYENGKAEIQRYWHLNFEPDLKRSEESFIEEFNYLFEDAVKLRLLSEVPLGAFLSGGIDSSAIVAMMTKLSSHRVKTFSIGFEEGGYHDETKYAEQVAKKFNTEHTTFKVGSDMLQMLPKYVHHFDEPFADYAAFPTYVVSKLAREHVTVVLTGDGGDEIFAGYERYRNEALADSVRKIPSLLRNSLISPSLSLLKKAFSPNGRTYQNLHAAQRKLLMSGLPMERRYIESFYKFNYPDKEQLLNQEMLRSDYCYQDFNNYWKGRSNYDYLSKRLYLDIMTSLPDDMLTKVDRVTMAVSLEARVPLIDYRIVELSAKIPSKMKITVMNMKRFLKHATTKYLPPQIINRPKHGFSSPIDKWLRHDLQEMVRDTLSEKALNDVGFFKSRYVHEMLDSHMAGKKNFGERLFMLMVFQMWYKQFLIKSK